ncbi:FG-GAP repeat domain-containing protein [Photobacterium aphoticum]|uniref:Uncharacterized protein n=1 Tax=Photobacterium aphoticum TaxID=754436 RepID=A0A0J1GP05_9GAMM|nr:hypothetical protein ABT58_07465 [Photobacterium aphoticum]GHA59401.1 hypothetical protein GCM10007086_36500 [Photobacterium aphoticum]
MRKLNRQILSSAVLSVLLIGCGEGSQGDTPAVDDKLVLNAEFAATYLQTIPKTPLSVTMRSSMPMNSEQPAQTTRYDGKLEVINVVSKDKQVFDWPMTQSVDAEGNVETISHRALTLKPGAYDFTLLLTSKTPAPRQYMAQALGEEIVDGQSPEIDFVLLPNLGETISDFEQVQYVSTLKFSWPAEELAGLSQPQFGLSINGEDERVYSINKETGIAELLMNVKPGEYQLAMRLYDGDLMVGKNDDQDNTVNFVEGENAQMDVIPLQADVNLTLGQLKDEGIFTFTVPAEVIHEVGSAQELALIVRLGGGKVPVQEKVLDVQDVNSTYQASALFETGGDRELNAYLAFHKVSGAAEQFDDAPLASCNTTINVAVNQTLGCKLELKRESIITGRVLGTLMLNVLDQQQQPATGVKVYIGDKLIGLTGEAYSTGSIKAHLVAGEHAILADDGLLSATDSVVMTPLAVENKVLYLDKKPHLGDGYFESTQYLSLGRGDDYWSDSSIIADVNGDGHLDLIFSRRRNTELIYINNGSGKFALSSSSFGDQTYTRVIAGADLNGDGHPDVVRATSEGDEIYFNNGVGEFTPSGQSLGQGKSQDLAIGDLNGDGYLDIVAAQEWRAPFIYLNDGKGRFTNSEEYISAVQGSYYPDVVLVDVNDDRHLDIVWAGGDHQNMILLNNGQAKFSDAGQRLGEKDTNEIFNVAVGDVNNDGKPDLLFTNIDYQGAERNVLYLNDGQGLYSLSDVDFGINGVDAAFADVDSNGTLDVFITGSNEEAAKLYMNDGIGNFSLSPLSKFGTHHHIPLFGDIDRDGDLDLISTYGNDSTIYLNQPAP